MALKTTSEVFTIGASVTMSGATTYTEQKIDLQLNPLDNEVLLIYAVDLQVGTPEAIDATDTSVLSQLTRTSQTAILGIDSSDVIANAEARIMASATPGGLVAFEQKSQTDSPPAHLDYVAIVATSDMFLSCDATGNTAAKDARVKIWCARARADAATYAALVQSELLSN